MTNNPSSLSAEKAARQGIELVQNGAELSPRHPINLTHARLRLGIDVGSTTVKLAVIDGNGSLVYANYERHHTDIKATAREIFEKAQRVLGDTPMVLLPSVDQGAVDTGLKYVNNDICYPSILTTGQIMDCSFRR